MCVSVKEFSQAEMVRLGSEAKFEPCSQTKLKVFAIL